MAALIPSASATGSGTMTLAGPSTNSNQTVTIPDATGTMMVSGNMPAFSAYSTATTTVPVSTWVKVPLATEEFDTANCFDSTTNYRFTPNVAGYYQVNCMGQIGAVSAAFYVGIYKNGSVFKVGGTNGNSSNATKASVSALIYLNGSTDYIEMYEWQNGLSSTTMQNNAFTNGDSQVMSASLVRSA